MSTAPSADKILGGYLMGILLAVAYVFFDISILYIGADRRDDPGYMGPVLHRLTSTG